METKSRLETSTIKLRSKVDDLLTEIATNKVNHKDWLTGKEVMNIIGICSSTLQSYRKLNKIGFSKLNKKKIQYSRSSVDKLLQANYVEPKTVNHE
jgi:hypothetical protein